MARTFVVEREPGALVPDPRDAPLVREPLDRRRRLDRRRGRRCPHVRRAKRVGGKRVLHVRENELLMLLFVMGAEQDHRQSARVARGQERDHPLIDARSPRAHLIEGGPREQAPRGPRMARPGRLVVRVEEEAPSVVAPPVSRVEAREHELFEEPGRMGQVPLGRARVRHRLHERVFRGKGRGEGLGPAADLLVPSNQGFSVHGGPLRGIERRSKTLVATRPP